MRILSVRLRNLNSLAGSWTIDLTAPEFAASGIFAITGPTGAGKSTILDAICLALFARTPRLGHISKGSNEIMSRQAGDCFAEVEFETTQGRFRCHWGQHRARRSSGGDLQVPRHEIVDALSDKVLESRSKEVGRLVEQVTGMDYDRFTRSMLLAQGDFAAFLQAEADQRAPILEQITGTSIYSRISIAVHERTSEERRKAALLEEAMGGVQLLGAEEEQALAAVIVEGMATAALMAQRLTALGQALHRLDRIEELRTQMAETDRLLEDLAHHRSAAIEELLQLERGQRAQGLAAEYSRCSQAQERIAALRTQAATLRTTIEQRQREQQQVARNHAQAVVALREVVALRQRENEVIREVRSIDLLLHGKKQAIARHVGLRQQTEREWAQVTGQRQHLMCQLTELHAQEEGLATFFRDHDRDGMLVEHLAGFRQQLQQLTAGEQALVRLDEERSAKQVVHAAAMQHAQAVERAEAQSAEQVAILRQRQHALEQERAVHLAGQDPPFWRQQVEAAQQELQRQEQVGQLFARCTELEQELAAFHQKVEEAQIQQLQQTEVLQALVEKQALQQQMISQMERNQELHRLVRNYEEERRRLQPGAACPLCGSTHHPWAEEHQPLDLQDEPIVEARAALEQKQSAMTGVRERLAVLARDIEHGQQAIEKSRHQRAALAEQLASLGMHEAEATAEQQLEATRARLLELRQRVQHLDRLEGELREAHVQSEQATARYAELRQQAQTVRHDLATLARELERLELQRQEEQRQIEGSRAELIRQMQPLGIDQCPPGQSTLLLGRLETRLQAWKEQQQRQDHLMRTRSQLQTELDKLDLLLGTIGRTADQQEAELADLRGEERVLLAQRHDRYGDRDPNVEEQRMNGKVQQAEALEVRLRDQLASIDREMHALRERLRHGEEELAHLLPHSQEQQAQLLAQVVSVGFASLDDFRQALLPAEILSALAERRRALEAEQTALAARRAEQAAALGRAQEEAGEQHDREALHAEHKTHSQELAALQQRIGAAQERRAANERSRQQVEVQRQALANQRKELERWESLHHLIGSADGKKFRVFAQGLTFEVMISHANRQLRKMSDRYILLRDPKEPLALQVLDNYQAGEIRSTRNLSGGESFLVSLALSLGLSAMASHNVRVDSLFLDEGFGTLDEEALDTALQTLAELRQDGKLIGVISHVPVLRDRIDLRIQVLPGPGGCSRLLGPGCRRDA
jgi:exonuclease SbcC